MRHATVLILALLATGAAQDKPAAVTYTKHIAPILFGNCTICHRPDEAAPFALLTYADAKKRGKQLLQAVESKQMPPWKPEAGHGDFVGERRLKAEDLAALKAWVDGGCAEGDSKDLPKPPKFPDGWAFGKPDLVVKMPEAYSVPAEGRDIYRAFVVPLGLKEDKFVRAVEFRPSNRKVVHHALMFLDIMGESRKRDQQEPGPGFRGLGLGLGALSGGSLGGWAPGGLSQPFPDGISKEIKQNADLVLQVHFNPTGKVEKEQSEVGIWFAKEKPRQLVQMIPLSEQRIDIPAGATAHRIADKLVLPVDVDLIGIIPHAHYLGKECKVWAKTPEGTEIPLVWIKDWDFDWQEQYRYKKVVRLPKGSELHMVWIYDNGADNPRNPVKPPKRVRFGEQTEDEMAMAFLQIATIRPGDMMQLLIAMGAKQFGR